MQDNWSIFMQMLKSALGRNMLKWFLFISVPPLIILSVLNYFNTYNSLKNQIDSALLESAEQKKAELNAYFSEIMIDLDSRSKSKESSKILGHLINAFNNSGKNLDRFVTSREYSGILQHQADDDLHTVKEIKGYENIYLLDSHGNILFTAEKESSLGSNIFFHDTLFAKACKQALNTGKPVFSDFERYAPANNKIRGFMVQAIQDAQYLKLGLIAFQISTDKMDEIVTRKATHFKSYDAYVVGSDLRIRTNIIPNEEPAFGTLVDTLQTRLWYDEHKIGHIKTQAGHQHDEVSKEKVIHTKTISYTGRKGREVLGNHRDLEIGGVPLAVIAEFSKAEAFATLQRLIIIAVAMLIVILVIVVFQTVYQTMKMVLPVIQMSEWAKAVAKGDLSHRKIAVPANEIGNMAGSLTAVVDSFKDIVKKADEIAKGNFRININLRSDNDELGIALQTMAGTLQDVVNQANAIAQGDYTADIALRSDKDELGASMRKMTKTLQETTASNQKALEKTRRLVSNLDNLPSPIMTIDKEFNITYLNPKAAQYSNLPREECMGGKCYDLFRTLHCNTSQCCSAQAMNIGKASTAENVIDPEGINLPVQYTSVPVRNSKGEIIGALEQLTDITMLKKVMDDISQHHWLSTGQAELSDRISGEQFFSTLAQKAVSYLAVYIGAQIGAIYVYENEILKLAGSYARSEQKQTANEFRLGQGLVGQAALEKKSILYTDIPDDYIKICSGIGEAVPRNILVIPMLHEDKLKGVIELGSSHDFTDLHKKFLEQAAKTIAIAGDLAQSRSRMKKLLNKTQQQAAELQTQQEELRVTNEEQEEQTKALKESEANLQAQEEELRAINAELENRTKALEIQQKKVKRKNLNLEESRRKLEEKSKALEMSSKYKSDFLANMSHELRSPLNSMLLLSQSLEDNKEGNLNENQMEFARTIHGSGEELLALINDILDLSKIEAGREEVHLEKVGIDELALYVERNFKHQAEDKGLTLNIEIEKGLPWSIQTDRQKLEQVIKNLMSNGLKFTSQGRISFNITRPPSGFDGSKWNLDPDHSIAITVSDTGVGIPKDKQKLIFEAFQQADGSTSRKYGGTGLGLSISRELAKLLGGGLGLTSKEGKGSTFSLYLTEEIKTETIEKMAETKGETPRRRRTDYIPVQREPKRPSKDTPIKLKTIPDDRKKISPKDRTLLIIEDDPAFAKIMMEPAHEKGFKVLAASDGETGLELASEYQPDAIILDIGLPGINGWMVMEKLKSSALTRHIPVHFISAMDEDNAAMRMGAIGFLSKPVSREELNNAFQKIEKIVSKTLKNLLIVEDDEATVKGMVELIGNHDVETSVASTGMEALELLKSREFDCVVLDLKLPDISGFELLKTLKKDETFVFPPVIVYTGRGLSREEEMQLQEYAQSILIKGADSTERLLGEITLFLHRVEADLSKSQQKILKKLYNKEKILKDKNILIVDDDARNVFALSQLLEEKGLKTIKAFDGKEALRQLSDHPKIDLVLMDIMMPEMDGYETMGKIRAQESFKKLPIIALTAKAMKEDRHKCIQAGATDYLPKPVNIHQLLSLIRVWLSQ